MNGFALCLSHFLSLKINTSFKKFFGDIYIITEMPYKASGLWDKI